MFSSHISRHIGVIAILLLASPALETRAASWSQKGFDDAQGSSSGSRTSTRAERSSRSSSMTLEDVREAIKKDKKNGLLYYRAGFLEEKRGNYQQAIKDYEEVIKLKSSQAATAQYRIGLSWELSGEFFDLEGKYGDQKGRVVQGGHLDRAINAYKEAIKMRPAFADAYYRLSLAYLLRSNIEDAQNAYKELNKVEPDSERTHQLLLSIYEAHQGKK